MGYIFKLLNYIQPKSLLSRFALIICVPMIVCQLVAVYIFYDRHVYNVSFQTSKMIANQVSLIFSELDDGALTKIVKYTKLFDIKLEKVEEFRASKRINLRLELNVLEQVLKENFPNYLSISSSKSDNEIRIFFKKDDKYFYKFTIPSKPLVNPTSEIFVFWIVGISMIFILVALIFAKNQIRSIEELADAANNFGENYSEKFKFKPSGALEIRKAGFALLKMQDRIEKQVKKRLQMLALISHDLRTPLTRMMLQLELSEKNQENDMLKKDAESMKHMIDSYLDFARGEGAEKFVAVDLIEWLNKFFDHYKYSKTKLVLNKKNKIFANIKQHAFARALTNIISNAEKYSNYSEFDCYEENGEVFFVVEDNGPGIKDDEKKLVFKAFYRTDKARGIDKYGSVGLGLSIAKEIVLSHKGAIKIEDSKKLGGTKVLINIPSYKKTEENS